MPANSTIPVALTIAGSDSGGGAGIQADIKSMQANGVFAASVITAVTAQNTRAVTASYDLPIDLIEAQFDAVFDDIRIDAVKTGMLSSSAIIAAVAARLSSVSTAPLVVDPVMISKSGYALLRDDAVEALKQRLMPLATLITPNVHEAEHLSGVTIRNESDARTAARRLHDMGAQAVLVKGGHLEGTQDSVDVFFDGKEFQVFSAPRINTPHTHGTGCTYASAVAANLAKGRDLVVSIRLAKEYVTEAIRAGLAIGGGQGPTDHFYFLREPSADDGKTP